MKCFNEEFIQKYIDYELSMPEKTMFEEHVETCEACFRAFQQHSKLVENFKQAMGLIADENIIIPPIKTKQTRKNTKAPKLKKLVYTLSAACIMLLIMIVLKNDANETTEDNNLYHRTEFYVDANQPLTEQELVIQTVNPEGEVTEYIIE